MTLKERLAYLGSMRLWLTPGMGVKRHVAAAVGGALLLVLGVAGELLWIFEGNRQLISDPIEGVLVSDPWRDYGGWISLALLLTGSATSVAAVGRLNRSLISNWLPRPHEAAVVLHRRLSLARGPRIVAIGGGTGLSRLLRGLRAHTSNLTAVVTVSDDGGSSGRLRDAFDMPAPGDLSDCLAALSDNELEVSRLLEYRFERGRELEGHTFGNLLITTLMEVEGDFARAIRGVNRLLNLAGSVYPATAQAVSLRVEKQDGTVVTGESRARDSGGAIRRVAIVPEHPAALPEVVADIAAADLVVLGPGSLFTSTIPPLLVPGVRRAMLTSRATLVYVCNIMTEAGETNGFDTTAHLEALYAHLGRYPNWLVFNSEPVDARRLRAYRGEGAEVVELEASFLEQHGVRLAQLDLLGPGPHAQHDPERLAEWLAGLAKAQGETRPRGSVNA